MPCTVLSAFMSCVVVVVVLVILFLTKIRMALTVFLGSLDNTHNSISVQPYLASAEVKAK